MQERHNSSALATELRLTCTNPSDVTRVFIVPWSKWIQKRHYITRSHDINVSSLYISFIVISISYPHGENMLPMSMFVQYCITQNQITSRLWFNIKMSSYQYRKSHCGDKTVVRLSYLHNGISYTGKMTSLYWLGLLVNGSQKTSFLHISVARFPLAWWFIPVQSCSYYTSIMDSTEIHIIQHMHSGRTSRISLVGGPSKIHPNLSSKLKATSYTVCKGNCLKTGKTINIKHTVLGMIFAWK